MIAGLVGTVSSVVLAILCGIGVAVVVWVYPIVPSLIERGNPPPAWLAWRRDYQAAVDALRHLGPNWTICWDRRLPGFPPPTTVAIGPTGVWALVVASPIATVDSKAMLAGLQDAGTINRAVPDLMMTTRWLKPGPNVTAAGPWAHEIVTAMLTAAVTTDASDRSLLVDAITMRTIAEPMVIE